MALGWIGQPQYLDTNSGGSQFYSDLAWSGLTTTDALLYGLTDSDQERILNVITKRERDMWKLTSSTGQPLTADTRVIILMVLLLWAGCSSTSVRNMDFKGTSEAFSMRNFFDAIDGDSARVVFVYDLDDRGIPPNLFLIDIVDKNGDVIELTTTSGTASTLVAPGVYRFRIGVPTVGDIVSPSVIVARGDSIHVQTRLSGRGYEIE